MLHCPGVLLFLKGSSTRRLGAFAGSWDSLILRREMGVIVDSPMEGLGLALVRVNIYVPRPLVQCNAALRCRNDLSGGRALPDSAGPRGGRGAPGFENGRHVGLLQNGSSIVINLSLSIYSFHGHLKTGGNSICYVVYLQLQLF